MPKFANENECTGCSACANVCPQQCIEMNEDAEGFVYPQIGNDSLCISCGACERTCPILNKTNNNDALTKAYAALSKDEGLRLKSSSGGIFSELAKAVLQSGGIIYGASYNENGLVEHINIENIEALGKLRGAKYSQSYIGDSFQVLKKQLNSGRKILFSGTPCQVAGLKSFLNQDYDNLFCIDFVCHGVPSPMVWEQYLKYRILIDKSSKAPEHINLRNKESGWSRYSYSVEFIYSDKKRYFCNNQDDPFMRLFVDNYILRRSCSNCKFKGYSRVSDITLGDFWGIWDIAPEMDDNKGTSLVLTHSMKGEEMFQKIYDKIFCKRVTFEQAAMMNQSMLQSVTHQANREIIINKIVQEGFRSVLSLVTARTSFKISVLRRFKNILGKISQ